MIAALLLAAGESIRMGRPKMTLPLGEGRTLISHMVGLFVEGGSDQVLVVTGGDRDAVETALKGSPVRLVPNPDFQLGGMISSIKAGLQVLQDSDAEAVAITPADLPRLNASTIQALFEEWHRTGGVILAPSYMDRRGHPILIDREVWSDILALPEGKTLRDYLRVQAKDIEYLGVNDPGVIQDLDTPEDYDRVRKGSG